MVLATHPLRTFTTKFTIDQVYFILFYPILFIFYLLLSLQNTHKLTIYVYKEKKNQQK